MRRLQDRAALVIGGSGGIGGAIARGFAAEGACLAIAGRTAAKVEATAADIKAMGAAVTGHAGPVTGRDDCAALIADVVGVHGRIDILVNCQGVGMFKPAAEVSAQDYDEVMETNLRSVFFACQAAYEHMREQGEGAIVNIGSMSAHRGWPSGSVYGASKHGVLAVTKSLACEWARDGVRVNSISPGFFLTDLNRERMSEDRKKTALARTPMARFGELDELVGAAVFLASAEARFVTGIDLPVDGGYLAQGI